MCAEEGAKYYYFIDFILMLFTMKTMRKTFFVNWLTSIAVFHRYSPTLSYSKNSLYADLREFMTPWFDYYGWKRYNHNNTYFSILIV